MKFEVAHTLGKAEAKRRMEKLATHWAGKYGVKVAWSGDSAKLEGKVMGVTLDAILQITDGTVGGDANDPGLLMRGPAQKYLKQKFAEVLDPATSIDDLGKA
jgi:hypothetical protein